MTTIFCAPLKWEADALRRGLPEKWRERVLRTGSGPTRAARAADGAAVRSADAVLVAGIAGGLDPSLRPGDVVVADRVIGPDGAETTCGSARMLAARLRADGLPARVGAVVSSDRLVSGPRRAELARSGAVAVDMESAALVATDRPTAVVRVIADPADGRLVAPATLGRVRKAVSTLAAVAPAVADWAAAVAPRTLLLAEPRSFCAGVERAIEVVEQALMQRGAPVYVRKQIVHNQHVVGDLAGRGAVFVEELDDVPTGATVVFSAHGVSPAVWQRAQDRELKVIDATCPLVTKVHSEVRRFADRGDTIIFIGHAGHEETEGTMGERPDSTVLVQDLADAETVQVPDPEHCSYLVQTTLSAYEVAGIVEVLRRRFPAIKGPATDDICYATTNRQDALRDVASAAELVLVVGSQNSSNSRRLVETAQRYGAEAHLVDYVDDVDLRWLAGVSKVGITAGASAPAALVDQVVAGIAGLGPVQVQTRRLVTENVHFTLPKEVRGA
ncbi:MAG TPA: 4-hydroxy-3-methylbut-2-enyl diphosphate reductase [Nakamurella sp.]|nr:4-hydroxy-3-methylbut-2-enyl diphosphate reductase [Nakamurella sp.]